MVGLTGTIPQSSDPKVVTTRGQWILHKGELLIIEGMAVLVNQQKSKVAPLC
tara:strand:+ start:547 stop:702 length:156 start_codon:yes stop_codon:yes gene_type:complete